MGEIRNRLDGLRKRCTCPRRRWSTCAHPWHFAFQWKGEHFRFSLDKHLGRTIVGKTEAEAEAEKIRAAIRSGTFRLGTPEPTTRETLTLEGLFELYRDRVVSTRAPSSQQRYRYAIGVIGRTPVPTLAGTPLPFGAWRVSDVTTDAVEQFRDIRRALSGATGTNRLLEVLSAVFAWAASRKRRLVDESPFRDGDQAAVEHFPEAARTRRLHPGEGERLLRACGDHLRAVVECALETGMRKGEILSLQWSQVRWSPRPQILLPASKTKTKRDRTIPVSARLRAILEMRRLDAAGDPMGPDAYVFGTVTGERVLDVKRAWQTTVLKAHGHAPTFVTTQKPAPPGSIRRPAKATNLSPESRAALKAIDLHFHDLRREAGSRWLDAGVPLHQVQAWLGHTNISQTSTYLAVTDTAADEAMVRFDRLRGLANEPTLSSGLNQETAAEILHTACTEEGEKWSGREDSNLRPLGPEPRRKRGQ
jgi:integrase